MFGEACENTHKAWIKRFGTIYLLSFYVGIPYFLNSQIISAVATNASRHTALQCRREAFLVKGSPCFHTRHHSPRPSAGDHRQAMPCQQPERHKTQRFLSKAPLPLLFTTELPKLTGLTKPQQVMTDPLVMTIIGLHLASKS